MIVVLYSTDCPRCRVLEKKLQQKNIGFTVNKNLDDITKIANSIGVFSVPLLSVDDQVLTFEQANQFINNF